MPSRALVLIADDDEGMRSLLGASLRNRGLKVDECSDGHELLDRLKDLGKRREPPSLVVSDVRMPGVNGLDVVHWVGRWLPEVPVILITAFGDAQTHRRAKALGAMAVLDKPFDMKEFHEHVSSALKKEEANGSP